MPKDLQLPLGNVHIVLTVSLVYIASSVLGGGAARSNGRSYRGLRAGLQRVIKIMTIALCCNATTETRNDVP